MKILLENKHFASDAIVFMNFTKKVAVIDGHNFDKMKLNKRLLLCDLFNDFFFIHQTKLKRENY